MKWMETDEPCPKCGELMHTDGVQVVCPSTCNFSRVLSEDDRRMYLRNARTRAEEPLAK